MRWRSRNVLYSGSDGGRRHRSLRCAGTRRSIPGRSFHGQCCRPGTGPQPSRSCIQYGTHWNVVYGKDNSLFHDYLTIGLMEGSWKPMLETEPDFSWPLDAYTITPADFGREVTQRLRKEWVTEAGASESLLDAICNETVKIPLGTWIGTTTALRQVDNRKALEALTVPTLVLWGTHDMVFDKDEQERVMHALQEAARVNNTPVVFKTYGKTVRRARDPQRDLGHNLHWAAPAQVAADIISFVRTGFPNDVQVWLNPENPYEV